MATELIDIAAFSFYWCSSSCLFAMLILLFYLMPIDNHAPNVFLGQQRTSRATDVIKYTPTTTASHAIGFLPEIGRDPTATITPAGIVD